MKIIISDLDGTLLMRNEDKLHRNVKQAIEEVLSYNIIFCVASGRAYSELKRIMADFEDRIYFIPSDGAMIIYKDEVLFESKIDSCNLGFLEDSGDYVLHGKYLSYVKSDKNFFVRRIKEQYHGHAIRISDLSEAEGDIYKIAMYNCTYMPELNRVYNDYNIKEYVNLGVNKGYAAKKLFDILSLKADDALAVGDSANDIELFECVGKSLAMIHSSPSVKKKATGICESFPKAVKMFAKEI